MFEAVYITDSKNSLAYENLVFQYVPTFLALANTLNTRFDNHESSPIQIVEVSRDYFICSKAIDRTIIYLLCLSRELADGFNPLAPFVFIDKLIETMKEYFGLPLTATKVTANNDTLSLLLHQMIADGLPHVTDFNNLKDVVLLKSILLKILHTGNQLAAAANNKSLSSLANNGIPASNTEKSPVPWRRANARYTNNEMFVDVTETVNVILGPKKAKNGLRLSLARNFDSAFYSTMSSQSGKRLVPVTGTISGQIEFLSRITGVPELQILLNSAKTYLEAPQFHRCIDLDVWRRSKSLSFIPPDGRSTLMTYQVDLDSLSKKTQLGMLGILEFDLQTELGIHKDEFELKITTLKDQAVPKIETIHVEIFAFEPLELENDNLSSSKINDIIPNGIDKMKAIRVTDGDFLYKGEGCGHWDIKNLTTGSQPSLRVAILTVNEMQDNPQELRRDELDVESEVQTHPISPLWLKVSFAYKGEVPSGLKIDSLKLISSKGMGESVKPYKGVKYITKTGDYSIRGR
ncbi:clathrin adaptor, mu subunit [Metschnikowia bicuspidata var. bicuspidata NRRL YB-4993]|uniref:Clathrin adaptor, mu subunit n=1 Tax=Metschnikowia bicuspidata var. bicuspidata NRRL YB-4993 TaxID=869754 RepID=A0A1A0H5S4_9ASCO|nr:clathrin adaptor, mu subunit [Metschnikowia bicuspidata var. bicuspidata NRRL YB-4993]OBA19257.1 clathrin adaptor, mu subunit [Metschnikowia bicuspidata var. bicuspidata NRRL YB-4993]